MHKTPLTPPPIRPPTFLSPPPAQPPPTHQATHPPDPPPTAPPTHLYIHDGSPTHALRHTHASAPPHPNPTQPDPTPPHPTPPHLSGHPVTRTPRPSKDPVILTVIHSLSRDTVALSSDFRPSAKKPRLELTAEQVRQRSLMARAQAVATEKVHRSYALPTPPAPTQSCLCTW